MGALSPPEVEPIGCFMRQELAMPQSRRGPMSFFSRISARTITPQHSTHNVEKQRFKISPLVFFLFSYRPPHIPAIVSGAHVSALYNTAVRAAPTTQPRGSSQPVGLTSPGCTRHTALPTVPRASVVPDLSHEMLRGCPTPTPLLDTSTVSSSWSGEGPAPTTPGKDQQSNDPKIQRSKDPKIHPPCQ